MYGTVSQGFLRHNHHTQKDINQDRNAQKQMSAITLTLTQHVIQKYSVVSLI